MATQTMQYAVRLQDINEDVVSMAVYFEVDDAATLADIQATMAVWALRLDAVTDAVIKEVRITCIQDPPVGAKTTAGDQPIATGQLSTYITTASNARAFGVTTPAFKRAFITGGKPDLTGANATYVGSWLTSFGTLAITLTTNIWGSLSRLHKNGINTRKHRREQDHVNFEVEP